MAKCINCSAPLPPSSIVCEYCGSRNDTDLSGIHHYTIHECDQVRTCPRCDIPMKTLDLNIDGRFLIERCDTCMGLFFDPGELEALLEASVSNVFEIQRQKLDQINQTMRHDEYGVTYIKCPVCAGLMNRVNFGTKSGVVVDRCRQHGVWLDGGEMRHLLEWMKAGGKLLHQEKLDREKARKEKERQKSRTVPGTFDSFGRDLKRDDPDLFTLVKKAMGWFIR